MKAAENGHASVVSYLLGSKANPDAAREQGWTSLMLACYNGHAEVVRALIAHKANLCLTKENSNYTALCFACYSGHEECARLLLLSRTSAEKQQGRLALAVAIEHRGELLGHEGHALCVEMLGYAGISRTPKLTTALSNTANSLSRRASQRDISNVPSRPRATEDRRMSKVQFVDEKNHPSRPADARAALGRIRGMRRLSNALGLKGVMPIASKAKLDESNEGKATQAKRSEDKAISV